VQGGLASLNLRFDPQTTAGRTSSATGERAATMDREWAAGSRPGLDDSFVGDPSLRQGIAVMAHDRYDGLVPITRAQDRVGGGTGRRPNAKRTLIRAPAPTW
jgi:hypothetical protein